MTRYERTEMFKNRSLKRLAAISTLTIVLGVINPSVSFATDRTYTIPAAFTAQTGSIGATTSVAVTFGTISGDVDAACAIVITPTSSAAGAGIATATFANTTLTAAQGWAVTATGTGALTMTLCPTILRPQKRQPMQK